MELEKTVRAIGSFMLALLIVAIPFMCGLSFAFNSLSFVKLILIMLTLGFAVIGAMLIYTESEE